VTKSVRLTRELRNTITIKALAGFMVAEKAAIEKRRVAFGIELYEHTHGSVEATVAGLPEVWREMTETIYIECEGFEVKCPPWKVHNHFLDSKVSLGRLRPVPVSNGSDLEIENANHPLWEKARQLVKDHVRIVKKEEELQQKIRDVLHSCNTVKQLEAAWPEGLQFLPANYTVTTTAIVPVGLSDQINAMLGIPSKASTATETVRKAATTK
jgi:hypothetical protein